MTDRAELYTQFTDLLRLPALTLATAGVDGEPHAAAVYFAADPLLRFYFYSLASSQHGLDLSANVRAAAALHAQPADWQEIRGLQMRGVVEALPPGAELEAGWQAYAAKFPFISNFNTALSRNTLYRFTPAWIRLIDNRRGFGFKQEWFLS